MPPSSAVHLLASRMSRGVGVGDDIIEEGEPGSERTSSVGAGAGGSGRPGSSSGSGVRIRTHGNAKERLASARAIVISGVGGVGKVSRRLRRGRRGRERDASSAN